MFYSGAKSKYSEPTYTYISETLINKFGNEIREEADSRIGFHSDSNIEERKAEFDKKHNFENASPWFAVVVKDIDVAIEKDPTYMLVMINNVGIDFYDSIKKGQILFMNHLLPDSYHYKKLAYNLVFKTNRANNISIENKKIKDLLKVGFEVNYDSFRKHLWRIYSKEKNFVNEDVLYVKPMKIK